MTVRFGSCELDAARRQLLREGREIHLTPKAFELLTVLVDAAPRVVKKAELHQCLWPNGIVSDAMLVGLIISWGFLVPHYTAVAGAIPPGTGLDAEQPLAGDIHLGRLRVCVRRRQHDGDGDDRCCSNEIHLTS